MIFEVRGTMALLILIPICAGGHFLDSLVSHVLPHSAEVGDLHQRQHVYFRTRRRGRREEDIGGLHISVYHFKRMQVD